MSASSNKRRKSAFVRSALLKQAAMTMSKFLLNVYRQLNPLIIKFDFFGDQTYGPTFSVSCVSGVSSRTYS